MQRILFTDDELWRAIAENTDAISALVHEQAELEAGVGTPEDPERTILIRSDAQKIDKFERQHRDFAGELRRRYP